MSDEPTLIHSAEEYERTFGPSMTVDSYGGVYSITRVPWSWWQRPRWAWRLAYRARSWMRGEDIIPPEPPLDFVHYLGDAVGTRLLADVKTSGEILRELDGPRRDVALLAGRRQERYYRLLIQRIYAAGRDWQWPEPGRYAPSQELLDAAGRQAVRRLRASYVPRALVEMIGAGGSYTGRIPCEGRPHG